MWHLRTMHGTFWIVQGKKEYYLGVNDLKLGVYNEPELAIKDVSEQNTGYFRWDCQSRVSAPKQISQWTPGEPQDWLVV